MNQQYMNQASASLNCLSSEELKELLNDDEKLEERINHATNNLEREKEIMLTENRSLAEENLNKEPQLIELRGRINDLSEEAKTLCSNVQEKLNEIKNKSGDLSQETALALLQTAAAESEEESEKIFNQLKDNEINVDVFLEQFMVSRKTMHLRKVKADKLKELLRQPTVQKGSMYPTPNTGFYPPQMGTAHQGSVPYPIGPMPMPMPNFFRPF